MSRQHQRLSTAGQGIDGALAPLALEERQVPPFADCVRPSSSTDTPCLRAKPMAAGVGWPSAPNAAETGGPLIQLFEVLLTLGDSGEPRRQPPRRGGPTLDRRAGGQPARPSVALPRARQIAASTPVTRQRAIPRRRFLSGALYPFFKPLRWGPTPSAPRQRSLALAPLVGD